MGFVMYDMYYYSLIKAYPLSGYGMDGLHLSLIVRLLKRLGP